MTASVADAWLDRLPDTVRGLWAEAVPDAVLQHWWAAGDRERVYQVCLWAPPSTLRFAMAAWFAGLDPRPTGDQVLRVARQLLDRDRAFGRYSLATLAVLPLGSDAVRRRVDAYLHADRHGRRLVELRIRSRPDRLRDPPTTDDGAQRALELGAAAVALLAEGDAPAATTALANAWAEAEIHTDLARFLLLPTRDLQKLETVPRHFFDEAPWLAFLAGLDSEERARKTLDLAPTDLQLAHVALGLGKLPDDWRATLTAFDDAELESRFAEGLYTAAERCALRLARALLQPPTPDSRPRSSPTPNASHRARRGCRTSRRSSRAAHSKPCGPSPPTSSPPRPHSSAASSATAAASRPRPRPARCSTASCAPPSSPSSPPWSKRSTPRRPNGSPPSSTPRSPGSPRPTPARRTRGCSATPTTKVAPCTR